MLVYLASCTHDFLQFIFVDVSGSASTPSHQVDNIADGILDKTDLNRERSPLFDRKKGLFDRKKGQHFLNYPEETYLYLSRRSNYWCFFRLNCNGPVINKTHLTLCDIKMHKLVFKESIMSHELKNVFRNYIFINAFETKPRLHLHFYFFEFYYQSRITPGIWWKLYNFEWDNMVGWELRYNNIRCSNVHCWDVTNDFIRDGLMFTRSPRYWLGCGSGLYWFPELNTIPHHSYLTSYIQNKNETPSWVLENLPASLILGYPSLISEESSTWIKGLIGCMF